VAGIAKSLDELWSAIAEKFSMKSWLVLSQKPTALGVKPLTIVTRREIGRSHVAQIGTIF